MLENLLRTLLRSVRLHDPLGVHPSFQDIRNIHPTTLNAEESLENSLQSPSDGTRAGFHRTYPPQEVVWAQQLPRCPCTGSDTPSAKLCRIRMTTREQKRHIRKNHIEFLKTPWTAGCPWDTWPVSRQKCPELPDVLLADIRGLLIFCRFFDIR